MKVYLGDAVYLRADGYGRWVLTTSDGIRDTNTIVLEPEVMAELLQVVEAWTNEQAKEFVE